MSKAASPQTSPEILRGHFLKKEKDRQISSGISSSSSVCCWHKTKSRAFGFSDCLLIVAWMKWKGLLVIGRRGCLKACQPTISKPQEFSKVTISRIKLGANGDL